MKDVEGRCAPDLLAQGSGPDFGAAVPLSAEAVDTNGEWFGVKLAVMGEDSEDQIAVFTHDQRRALAAVNRFAREEWSSKVKTADFQVVKLSSRELRPEQWWVILDNCGCGETCPHPVAADGWRDCECKQYGLPPCCKETLAWTGRLVPEGTPGALAVLVVEVSFR